MNDIAPIRATEAAGVGPDRPKGLSDDDLLELVQRQTFRFFWDGAHPISGLARDRTNVQDKYGPEAMAIGGTGFGAIAIVVAAERGWISRGEAVDQLLKMVKFLHLGAHFHGVLPHFMHGTTGAAIAFSRKDDGSDVVEQAFLIGGLLVARQYFDGDGKEAELRDRINVLWNQTEWDWHTRGGRHIMYWHWSPNQGWGMDFEIRGWNECLLTYVLGASSNTYPIQKEAYHRGWAMGRVFKNERDYYGIKLPLGPDFGGPLFWTQYCFMML
ncbi:MAG: glucoamylase family protein, partial [Geminicoccaceae bacterium]